MAGITNTKIVKNRIQRHIRDHGWGKKSLREQIKSLKRDPRVYTDYQAGLKLVDGGSFDIYYDQVKKTLNKEFKINPQNKKYSDDKSWQQYRHLIAREIENMIKPPKPRKKR